MKIDLTAVELSYGFNRLKKEHRWRHTPYMRDMGFTVYDHVRRMLWDPDSKLTYDDKLKICLHDALEIYTGDIPSDLKRLMYLDNIEDWEARIIRYMYKRIIEDFNLPKRMTVAELYKYMVWWKGYDHVRYLDHWAAVDEIDEMTERFNVLPKEPKDYLKRLMSVYAGSVMALDCKILLKRMKGTRKC
jgi:hypothetical protein